MLPFAQVVEKIRKLQALAAGSTSEGEIRNAAAAAERLIAEYRVAQVDLEIAGTPVSDDPVVKKSISASKKRVAYKEALLSALVSHYGCAWYLQSGRTGGDYSQGREGSKGNCTYTLFGKTSDLAILDYMFDYLCDEIDGVGSHVCKGQGVSYANAWRLGCARGIGEQFTKMREAARQAAATSSAMVLLDKREAESKLALRSSGVKLGTCSAIRGGRDTNGYYAGKAHGSNMSIRQGMSGGSSTPKLG